ncbi:hypothetical protein EDB89DRAFT_1903706 [Lactarius sanguifluus]|nr:hypothetical protein EDB89DRAFT_1903706 [Lactarius sanguifluus]
MATTTAMGQGDCDDDDDGHGTTTMDDYNEAMEMAMATGLPRGGHDGHGDGDGMGRAHGDDDGACGYGYPSNPRSVASPVRTHTRMHGLPVPATTGTGFNGYGVQLKPSHFRPVKSGRYYHGSKVKPERVRNDRYTHGIGREGGRQAEARRRMRSVNALSARETGEVGSGREKMSGMSGAKGFGKREKVARSRTRVGERWK